MTFVVPGRIICVLHNGGTGHYNSYLGFSPEKQCAVVVLSNTAPSYRIPATVIGSKLLRGLCSEEKCAGKNLKKFRKALDKRRIL